MEETEIMSKITLFLVIHTFVLLSNNNVTFFTVDQGKHFGYCVFCFTFFVQSCVREC